MAYRLGSKSIANLDGVHDDLATVLRRAIRLSEQDYAVFEGLRSSKRQKELFDKGASKIDGITKIGRHQSGHAADVVPYINGGLRWEWELIFPIADAINRAARDLLIPIRWGGCWCEITSQRYEGMSARSIYDSNPSWDGAHFELPSHAYN